MGTATASRITVTTLGRPSETGEEVPNILAAGLEALDLLNIGVAVTNGSRQLLFANQTAEQILLARDGLEVTEQNVLGPASRWSCGSLSHAIQQAALPPQPGDQEPKDVILAVRRPSGKRPLTLLVRSLKTRLSPRDLAGPSVLVFIWDPELPMHDTQVGLRELFGFTSCEARLANLLMEGKTVDDCCTHLDIRPSTVRMHLANLFAKTGVQRQGQLVSLLWKSVGMVRTKQDKGSLNDRQSMKPPQSSNCLRAPKRMGPGETDSGMKVRAIARDCRF
jgi:DNA-binding CsgD family transcriptional regulator